MREIKLTQGKVAIIDDEDYEVISSYTWHYHSTGYAFTHDPKNPNKKIRLHHAILPKLPKHQVDHINGDRLDNRRSNLRLVKVKYNTWNKGMMSNNTSGYKGVNWNKQQGKWRARIVANGKEHYLGFFDDPVEAAKNYNDAAVYYHGEYARLNKIPGYKYE